MKMFITSICKINKCLKNVIKGKFKGKKIMFTFILFVKAWYDFIEYKAGYDFIEYKIRQFKKKNR